MGAMILSGGEVAESVRASVAERVAALGERGTGVGLATVLVGEDAASRIYVSAKQNAAAGAGIQTFDHSLPDHTTQEHIERLVADLNQDDEVDGILVQLPLPEHVDEIAIVSAIDPSKDADGLHPVNLGRLVLDRPFVAPATPQGILAMLDHYGISTRGAVVVVVGRSFLVGRPLAILLGHRGRDATVALAHSRTKDLRSLTRIADILVAATGMPGLIGADDVKPGGTVIDVGINRLGDRLVGDVDYEAVAGVAGAITPVPGGVGPMTIACLLENTVTVAEHRAEGTGPPPTLR